MIFITIFDPGTFLQKQENIASSFNIFLESMKMDRGAIYKSTLTLLLIDNQVDDRAIGKVPLI